MPPSHYRRRTHKFSNSPIPTYILRPANILSTNDNIISQEIIQFQKLICDIIEIISTTLDIKSITLKVQEVLLIVNSRQQYFDTIDLIEESVLGVVGNISNCVDIGIIRCRIDYIRELINNIPDTGCTTYNPDLASQIFKLLDSVINDIDFTVLISNINKFRFNITSDIEFVQQINTIENIILDIVSNIRDSVDIGIIRCRIQYLLELINKIQC
jgi:hypothetical protein